MNDGAPPPSIAEFFAGQSVLITGATGFIGEVLLEKLLRSCPALSTVFLLVRPKQGASVEQRVSALLDKPLFDCLGAASRNKLVGIAGDVSKPGLGLGEQDRQRLADQVTVVFHAAASINFNAALDSAINVNLLGTRRVLELCHHMPHIKALVYVSTAFCNCQENETVLEEVYPTLYEPDFIIELVQKMTPEEIQEATPGLLKDHPNTYSFSKQLAENLVKSERRALPVAIVRPTIVLGTAKEPMSGWIDNVHTGGFAFIAGAGKGVFRVSCAEPDFVADLVPCDHVANLLIAAAWSAAVKSGDADLQVYHCSSGAHNPITWGQYTREVVSLVRRFPCRSVLWYPGAQCRTAVPRVALVVLLRHMLPAYLLRLLSGGDDELLKIQKKYWRGIQHVRYFTTRQWRFSTINTLALARQLCPRDRVTFAFDVASIHWPAYLESNVLGVRQHYHHDPPSTLKEARWKLRVIHLCCWLCQALLFVLMCSLLSLLTPSTWASSVLSLAIALFFLWL